MLTKILIATIVFLELFNVPNAEGVVENWSKRVLGREVIKSQTFPLKSLTQIPKLEAFAPLPVKTGKSKEPSLGASSVLALDLSTAKILYEKNADEKIPIASLTKIMTALIVLENYDQDEILTVPKEATGLLPGAVIYLREGEKMTVSNLLYGLLLYSGNDCAYTLSSKIGEKKFVRLMNEKAKALGFKNTQFVDSAGLKGENVSTARELAFLFALALRNQNFSKIVKTNEITITSVDKTISHPLKNTNKLLREYEGTYAGKTGYTEEAGHCLVTGTSRGGRKILTVVMKSPKNQFEESKKLLDWVYGNYRW